MGGILNLVLRRDPSLYSGTGGSVLVVEGVVVEEVGVLVGSWSW